MKLFLYIILFVSVLSGNTVFPQCNFMKIYDHSHFFDGAATAIQTFDGGYITGGNSFAYFTNEDGIYIIRVNQCGDTLWSFYNNISPPGGEDCKSIIQLSDGYFTVSGCFYDSTEGARNTFLLKLSSTGEQIWLKPINAGFNDRGIKHYQTSDKGFLIGGFFTDLESITSTLFLLKTDSLANIEWQKNYSPDTGFYELRNFEKTQDNGYILSGNFYRNSTGNYDIFLLKTDSAGNFKWIKYYGTNVAEGYGFVTQTPDGGFAVAGYKDIIPNTEPCGWIFKTDSGGNMLWQKQYYIPGVISLFHVVRQLPDGNFIVGGGTGDLNFPNHGPRVWLLKLNAQGDTLWTKKLTYYGKSQQYGNITHDYIEDLNLTSDGGFIISGYVINNLIPTYNDLLLIKTDSLGNTCEIDTTTFMGCSGLTSVVKLPEYLKAETLVYPNPASEVLNIYTGTAGNAEIFIYDLQGSLLLQKVCYQNSTVLDIQHFSQGVYFVKVVTGKGVVIKRFVKE